MKPSIQKLQKFFKLEAERGYDNHAVLGGLERMLERWEGEARADGMAEDLIQFVAGRLRDYGRLAEKSRAETLQGIWKRVTRNESGIPQEDAALNLPTPSAPPPAAAPQESAFPPPARPAPRPSAEPPRQNQAPANPPRPRSEQQAAAPSQAPARQRGPTPGFTPAPVAATTVAPFPRVVPRRRTTTGGMQTGAEPPALNAPLTVMRGIGPHNAQTLERLGLHTLRDLLYFFPRRYQDFSQQKQINRLTYGEEVTVLATVQSISARPLKSGALLLVEAIVTDGTGSLRVNWFNQRSIAQRLHKDTHVSLSGKIGQYLGRLTMENPAWEAVDEQMLNTNRIVPVYPSTANISQKWLRDKIHTAVMFWGARLPDPLPETVRRQAELMDLADALMQIHFPDSWDELKAAQERLAFDEIFLLQLGVLRQKREWQARSGRSFATSPDWLGGQLARLPFSLTGAQQRALQDIIGDLSQPHPMNRLVQGDVGSGKTIVAALAAAAITAHGAQVALMAPTSILAEQHYKSLLRVLSGSFPPPAAPVVADAPEPIVIEQAAPEAGASPMPGPAEVFQQSEPPLVAQPLDEETPTAVAQATPAAAEIYQAPEPAFPPAEAPLQPEQIRLMVGATSEAEKAEIRAGLADGSIRLVIGTHALIEDPVIFNELQLVIVDEQHRFGVEQRAALRRKGENPHLLVMTATPIPRSLALTLYGDLDVSIIDELPPGRQPVGTYVITPRERERAYSLIRSQVETGRQVFIIYPLIDESENSDAKAAVVEQARLQAEIFPRLNVGLLHGRMRPDEKDAVMEDFRQQRYHILVSTTVVEVGVDIPNASVMLIEGANRFGLAQLHQLRGRVGRGAERAYCLLIPDAPDQGENERLQVMAMTNDGFLLAEKDLEQRGPGQFLGARQAGYAEMQFANLTNIRLIEKARRQAQALFEQDAELSNPEHALLASALQHAWAGQGDIS